VRSKQIGAAVLFGLLVTAPAERAFGQTLVDSLAAAYSTNSELNAARSRVRAIDENVALARSGNRPIVEALFRHSNSTSRTLGNNPVGGTSGARPTSISVRLTQPLFQGFQVRNRIRGAEAAVKAQRASLQNTEQDILLDVVTAFADVVQNSSILSLRESDVSFLEEQVRAAQDRFEVGEGTRTDVSQAEARLAQAQSALAFASANLESARATFRRLTGLVPRNLVDDFKVDPLLPPSVDAAVDIGQEGHPAIVASLFDVDVAMFNVKEVEGEALPTVSLFGEAGTTFDPPGANVNREDSATVGIDVSIPIYQQGRVSAQVRQAKEELGTSRIQVDVTRDLVRQNTVAAWAAWRASVRSIFAARTGVFAAQLALQGVIEEQRVGQRTTLDVLDAQRELVQAQVTLVEAERDAEVAAFSLLAAVGRLSAQRLGLPVEVYRPEEHYTAVRDKWHGLRTPDAR